MLTQGRARLIDADLFYFSPGFLVAQRTCSNSLSLVLQQWEESFSLVQWPHAFV